MVTMRSAMGMKRIAFLLVAIAVVAVAVASMAPASEGVDQQAAPIFGVRIPPGYRDWRLISVAHGAGNLNDLRAILGNEQRSTPTEKTGSRSRTGQSSPGSLGVTCRPRRTTESLAAPNLSLPGFPRTEFSLWSRTHKNTPHGRLGICAN